MTKPFPDEEWLRREYATKPYTKIAREQHVSIRAVMQWLDHYGIERRPRGRQPVFYVNNGRYVSRGYVFLRADGHPRAHKGYVPEHILVMEAHLGRFVTRTEHVHHINHDKTDNRIENLSLMTSNAAHSSHHRVGEDPRRQLLRDRRWLESRLQDGLSYRKIGALAGCTGVAVMKWAQKHGLSPAHPRPY